MPLCHKQKVAQLGGTGYHSVGGIGISKSILGRAGESAMGP